MLFEKTANDGSYSFIAPLTNSQSYNLKFYNDNTFSKTKNITLADTSQLKTLKTVLPKLKKGTKYSIGSINSIGASVQYLQR